MTRHSRQPPILSLSIGGVTLSFSISHRGFYTRLCRRYHGFVVPGVRTKGRIAVTIVARRGQSDPGAVRIRREKGVVRIERRDFGFVGDMESGTLSTWPSVYSFDTFLRILLSSELLHKDRGVLLHAAATRRGGCGYLFVGESGAGKSTMARMHPASSVLTDELALVTRSGRTGFAVWGTPFWGDFAGGNNPRSAPVHTVAVLRKGTRWSVDPISPGHAVGALLKSVMLHERSAQCVEHAFTWCARMVREVPLCTLTTRRERRVPSSVYAALRRASRCESGATA